MLAHFENSSSSYFSTLPSNISITSKTTLHKYSRPDAHPSYHISQMTRPTPLQNYASKHQTIPKCLHSNTHVNCDQNTPNYLLKKLCTPSWQTYNIVKHSKHNLASSGNQCTSQPNSEQKGQSLNLTTKEIAERICTNCCKSLQEKAS